MNVYAEAATRANVPENIRDEVIVATIERMHAMLVSMASDEMHELVMDHMEELPR